MAPSSFSCYRSIAPTLTVLLVLALLETAVVHLVAVALWGWTVAVLLGGLDLAAIVWRGALLRSIRTRPVTIGDGVLTMRLGHLRTLSIPIDRIDGARANWNAATLKRRDVANLALATWPNIVLDLTEPVPLRGRPIRTVAHKLDDPAALLAALRLPRSNVPVGRVGAP